MKMSLYDNITDQIKNNKDKFTEAFESIDAPSYYNQGEMDPITAFQKGLFPREEYIGFLKGNIIKYTIRCTHKGGVKDLDKCINYINYLRECLEDD